jgi:pentatricopeptide repeat protein
MLRSTTPRLTQQLRTHSKTVVTRLLTNSRIPPSTTEPSPWVTHVSRPLKLDWPTTLRADWAAVDNALPPIPPEPEPPVEKSTNKDLYPTALDEPLDAQSRRALADFFSGMVTDELPKIIRALTQLKSYGALRKVQESDVIKLSQLLSEYLARAPVNDERTSAEDIAVYLASRGSHQPLSAAMAFHLDRNNTEKVFSLWDKYAESANRRTERFNVRFGNFGANDNHLFVIAAAAIKDDFARAVDVMNQTQINFASWRVHDFISRHLLDQTALVRQRFLDFLHDATISRDLSDFGLLVEQVSDMARISDHEALLSLYTSIKDGLERGIFVPSQVKQPASNGVTYVTRDLWSLFVWGAVECQKLALAEKFIQEMTKYKVTPSLETWNCLLHGYSKANLDGMMDVIQRVRASGLEPDVKTLSIIMGAMFDKKNVDRAMDIFKTIRTHAVPPEEVDQGNVAPKLLAAYNIALNGLLRARQIPAAKTLLNKMQQEGPFPDIITYNTLLNRYMHMKDKHNMAQTLRDMAEARLQPDIYTYTILFVGAARERDEAMKSDIVRRMKATEVKPNRALLSAGIHSILTSGEVDPIPTAMTLLRMMERDPDIDLKPNEVTYHTIMNAIDQSLQRKEIGPSRARLWTQELHQRMIAQSLRPNRPILHLLMKMHLEDITSPDSIEKAMSIFKQLDKEGLLNTDGWFVLLFGLEKRKEIGLAKQMISKLRKSTWEARGSLLLLVDRLNSY